jgi:hypothetical protein
VKNDRRHFKRPQEPLARGDTGSESVVQLICHYEHRRDLPMRSNPKVLRKDCFDKKRPPMTEWCDLPAACPPSFWRSYLTGSSPPLGEPPTGFSEPDVGEPPDVECDIGWTLDEFVSYESETTLLTDDEVHIDYCLTIDSKRFQLCQN